MARPNRAPKVVCFRRRYRSRWRQRQPSRLRSQAPTLVTSWYGMNFKHMPELDGRYSYWIVMGVTIGICAAIYVWLKRARWL